MEIRAGTRYYEHQEQMTVANLAELIASLPPEYQREALNYVQYLKERNEQDRRRILQRLVEAETHRKAGRVYSDAELAAYFEDRYGPLPPT